MRSELRAEIRSLDAKVSSLDAKVDSLEFKMESRFEQVQASIHRTQVIMEEQRSENRIVLDGLKTVLDRQDRLEQENARTRQAIDALSKTAIRPA